ncbi:target of Myb protein 1 isoform X2 [Amborella trichopoda]|nr:target of Myb protein 1 isoform X2 [Amborella trichopoda]|eukprot:XP_020517761.1 target of Myb protein 1 isoform X2 [Amborella trichopoda]
MKNCGELVHHQVVEGCILQEMIKIVKRTTDMHVRDKILVLLDSWQKAFGGPGGKNPQFFWACSELRQSGMEFPKQSDKMVPIFTPPLRHSARIQSHANYGLSVHVVRQLDEVMASEMKGLSLSDMEHSQHVMVLLSDMLNAANPNSRESVKDDVIEDLVNQCRTNQRRLMQLIDTTMDEDLLKEGLSLNDKLQYLLAKHDAIALGAPLPPKLVESSPQSTSSLTVVKNSEAKEEHEDDDDGFAQLARRSSRATSTATRVIEKASNADVSSSSLVDASASSNSPSGQLVVLERPQPMKFRQDEPNGMINLFDSNPHPVASFSQPFSQVPARMGHSYVQRSQSNSYYRWNLPQNNYVAPWALNYVHGKTRSSGTSEDKEQSEDRSTPHAYPPPPWALGNRSPIPLLTPSQSLYRSNRNPSFPAPTLPGLRNSGSSRGGMLALDVKSETTASDWVNGQASSPKKFVHPRRLVGDHVGINNTIMINRTTDGSSI